MIFPPKKVFVKESPGKGMGVFALEPIREGEVIEVCHIEILKSGEDKMPRHAYGFPKRAESADYIFLPWGFGAIYNHSEEPNIDWKSDGKTMTWYAIKDIDAQEECCGTYHQRYWKYHQETKII